MCRFYGSGTCKRGNVCPFAHGLHELNAAPDLTKTSMCTAFMAGHCYKSAQCCKFAHGVQDLRKTPLFRQMVTMSAHDDKRPTSSSGLDSTELPVSSITLRPTPPSSDIDPLEGPPPWISSPPTSDIDPDEYPLRAVQSHPVGPLVCGPDLYENAKLPTTAASDIDRNWLAGCSSHMDLLGKPCASSTTSYAYQWISKTERFLQEASVDTRDLLAQELQDAFPEGYDD